MQKGIVSRTWTIRHGTSGLPGAIVWNGDEVVDSREGKSRKAKIAKGESQNKRKSRREKKARVLSAKKHKGHN